MRVCGHVPFKLPNLKELLIQMIVHVHLESRPGFKAFAADFAGE